MFILGSGLTLVKAGVYFFVVVVVYLLQTAVVEAVNRGFKDTFCA